MQRALEWLMYAAFSAAALPAAWMGWSNLSYYRAHPEMLETRDSAPEVFATLFAVQVMMICLLVAAALALFVLRAGPFAARVSVIVLVIAWVAAFFQPETSFRSFQGLYWEALPFMALALLPWICAGARFAFPARKPIALPN